VFDSAGQQTQLQSAYGTSIQAADWTATYTSNGKLATITDGEGNRTTYEYDGHGRLAKTFLPVSTKGAATSSTSDYEELTYDSGSNVVSRRLRDGNGIGMSYDALNRLIAKDLPGSEPDVAYTYDALSRMTGASQTGNALTFGYDALSRLTSAGGPQGTTSPACDAAGRRGLSIHVLQADAQIVPPRHQGQSRRGPQARETDPVDPRPLRHRAPEDERPQGDQLKRRLPLGQSADRERDLQAGEELAKPGDGDLAKQDDQRRDDVEAVDDGLGVGLAGRDEHDDDSDHHDLVGDGVEEDSEPRHRALGAGEVAVEIIGDPDHAVEAEGDGVIVPARLPEQIDEDRNGEDPRQGEEVGQGQHRGLRP
jgi:YD repeat-containing protein